MVTNTSQERFRTDQGVFDELTKRNLFVLQSKGVFDELVGPLKVGKESNVFIAKKEDKKLIVKIYRVQNCDFKRMYNYIKKDPRYDFLKNKRRQIIFCWTQREFRNLKLAEKAKIDVPQPIAFRDNIIVEQFIGDEEAAPTLKDAYPKNPQTFLKAIVIQIKQLYEAGLIHGDLSSFNILNYHEKPCLIDFSQATLVRTPNSEELLMRDVKNVVHFFHKFKIKVDEMELYLEIIKK